MPPPTDAALLASFARDRDEAAFRVLAERHFGLIFHTALRRTGSRTLAEEVSQNILCTVARKAAMLVLRADRFPAWLHRATLFEASKAMRTAASRLRHSQLQHPDEIPATGDQPAAVWESALPHLDEAINALPESDRHVLMLHFFENMAFPRIGALLGKPPATVQKQSVRALEKLGRLLCPHGAAVPLATLSTGMLAESAKAAPTGLLPSLTKTAVASAPAATFTAKLTVMTATHSKAVLTTILLAVALPLGLQQFAIANVRSELAGFTTTVVVPPRTHLSVQARPAAEGQDALLFRLSEEIITGQHVEPVRLALDRRLAAMSMEEQIQLLEQISASGALGQYRRNLLQEAIGPLVMKRDLAAGMRLAAKGNWLGANWVSEAYGQWLRDDPEAAGKWLEENHELASRPEGWKQLEPYLVSFTRMILETNPAATSDFLDHFPAAQGQQLIKDAVPGIYGGYLDHSPGEAEAVVWLKLLRDRISNPEDRKRILENFGVTYYKGHGIYSLENMKPLANLALPLEERHIIADAVAEQAIMGTSRPPPPDLATKTRAWLDDFIPEEAEAIAASAQKRVDARREEEAVGLLNYFKEQTVVSDDDIIRNLSVTDCSHIWRKLSLSPPAFRIRRNGPPWRHN